LLRVQGSGFRKNILLLTFYRYAYYKAGWGKRQWFFDTKPELSINMSESAFTPPHPHILTLAHRYFRFNRFKRISFPALADNSETNLLLRYLNGALGSLLNGVDLLFPVINDQLEMILEL